MNYGIVAGVIAAILLIVKYMMGRARTDTILSELQQVNSQKKKDAHLKEAARLEQEIEDAKIDYARIRDKHKSPSPSEDAKP
jgi:hypothetical protein